LGASLSVSFNFVTERIAVGGEILSKDDVDEIVGAGITHVIDMRAEFDDDTLNDNRIAILWLPQVDDGTMRPPGQYRKGIQFALPALSLPNAKVFLHCSAGLNRGPTMCYAILRAFGFSQAEAISRIRAARPEVVFYVVQNYLDSVERDLTS
jgi:protein-tyrosine phosphatase